MLYKEYGKVASMRLNFLASQGTHADQFTVSLTINAVSNQRIQLLELLVCKSDIARLLRISYIYSYSLFHFKTASFWFFSVYVVPFELSSGSC